MISPLLLFGHGPYLLGVHETDELGMVGAQVGLDHLVEVILGHATHDRATGSGEALCHSAALLFEDWALSQIGISE